MIPENTMYADLLAASTHTDIWFQPQSIKHIVSTLLQTSWSMTASTHYRHQQQTPPLWLKYTDESTGIWLTLHTSHACTADDTKASYVQLAAEAIFTKVFTCCTHIEDGYLSKIGAGFKCGKHRSAIISNYLQAPPVNDVHLLPHLTCAQTNVSLTQLTYQAGDI